MTKDIKMDQAPQTTVKKRKIASLERRKARSGWLFVLPFIIGFLIIYVPMIVQSIEMSFSTVELLTGDQSGFKLTFTGFENYRYALFTDPDFVQTLLAAIGQLAFNVPAILIFSLFMAVMLNQKMAGRAAFRAIFFVPVILSTGIMGSLEASTTENDMEESIDTGAGTNSAALDLTGMLDLTRLFENLKIGDGLVTYVQTALASVETIVNRSGVQMLIFLAALQSISPAIYESCKIDGATSWETFWKITFPMISPMILVNGVYTIIDSFTAADNPVMKYMEQAKSMVNGNVIASAMAWLYFLVVILIVAVIALVLSSFVFYQRKND